MRLLNLLPNWELSQVQQVPLFHTMADACFATLMRAAYDQTFPASMHLAEQGAAVDFLHIVVEGSFERYASWQDRETTMAVVCPVSSFILAACIKDAPYMMSARTLEKTRDSGSASFIIPIEKRVPASCLGVTPESPSRTMKLLQEVGAKIDGEREIITNRKALEAVAHPSPLIDWPDCEDPRALAAGSGEASAAAGAEAVHSYTY